jgi:hypothetical protein
MARLTLQQIEDAIQHRVNGKTYNEIASELGVINSDTFRRQVVDALTARTNQLAVDMAATYVLDLARLESMIPKNLELAQQGSDRHVKAVIQIMRAKAEHIGHLQELLENQDEDNDHNVTMTSDDEEFMLAVEHLNAEVIEGTSTEHQHQASIDTKDVTEKELQLLREQMDEFELSIGIEGSDEEEGI